VETPVTKETPVERKNLLLFISPYIGKIIIPFDELHDFSEG
jgi:hypothetical protein